VCQSGQIKGQANGILSTGPPEVLRVATIIVGAFAAIIIGAAGAFAYVVFLSDDKTPTGP
jgi:hypothetical protein